MTDEALQARRQYHREWSRKNPDKIREYERTYWERQAAKANEDNSKQ